MYKTALAFSSFFFLGHGWQLQDSSRHENRKLGSLRRASEFNPNKPVLVELLFALHPTLHLRAFHPRHKASQQTARLQTIGMRSPMAFPGVDQQVQAYEWMANLGAPAALVAGASLASLYQLQGDVWEEEDERTWVSFAKKLGEILFLSGFVLEIGCVFVATVTGTLLLGKGVANPVAPAAMLMLRRELEFEYLSSRVFFFQGLLNWLCGVAVQLAIPRPNTTKAAFCLQRAFALSISSVLIYMIAYYNKHISFYSNYGTMLIRLASLTIHRYYHLSNFRILPAIALIPLVLAFKNAWLGFFGSSEKEIHEEDTA